MSWDVEHISLDDQRRFETLNGLWTGKNPPFVTAGVIRNTNFTESGRVDYSDVAYLQVEQKRLTKLRLKPGDIIVERSGGGPKQPVGRVVYFASEDGPFSFSNFTSAIRVRNMEEFDPRFVFYGLLELYHSGRTEDIQRRTTGIRNLDFAAYKQRATFPLITIDEQRKVAGVLSLMQRAEEEQERLLARTIELKSTLLRQLFTRGLRDEAQKQTSVGPVPKNWGECALEQTGEVVYGIQAAVASNVKPIGTKILTNKNISLDGRIILDSINYFVLKTKRHHDTLLRKGDLLFNWRSGSKEHVGKTAYFNLEGEFTHSSFILRIRPRDEITGRFLFYYLNFLRESGYFVRTQTFAVNAKFNKSAINRLPTYLPKEDERREIVAALDAVSKKIEMVEEKKRLLNELFRTLLHQLMTAQMRVHNLDLPELQTQLAA
jgi:type I restriction enzyme S subunit